MSTLKMLGADLLAAWRLVWWFVWPLLAVGAFMALLLGFGCALQRVAH